MSKIDISTRFILLDYFVAVLNFLICKRRALYNGITVPDHLILEIAEAVYRPPREAGRLEAFTDTILEQTITVEENFLKYRVN